ncbi:MAG: GntR family transcriptional regulator [Gordonia sp. (in: high G+C Gram-positive bacteria)]|uniref:GntR family transcriptional regulator n=1 Tax=Gordonia sp. (in: high G+C Gram-positive bacteria) TaxID=84139 RepID=UPI0039E68B64
MNGPARIVLDDNDPAPAYEQIHRQIVGHIASGALPVGSRLPPLRQLAGDLRIAVNTAARAYQMLDESGLTQSRRGGGTRVAARPAADDPTVARAALDDLAERYLRDAQHLGNSPQQAVEAVVDRVRHHSKG